jgi:hypothetical protein
MKHKKRKPKPPRRRKRLSRQAKVNITQEANHIIQCVYLARTNVTKRPIKMLPLVNKLEFGGR